jgi:23S rRNA (adenine2503-C2)-methyltransferase
MSAPPINLYDLPRPAIERLLERWEFNPVHAARIWHYLYFAGVKTIAEMAEVPLRLRRRLAEEAHLPRLGVAHEAYSSDGFTRKYLLGLHDGNRIETVLMKFTGRVTACVSSQVGCAMGCVFCATGQMGYTRHLSAGEIVAQAMHVREVVRSLAADSPDPEGEDKLRNIVLMGMGEPLHNYDAVMDAIDILRDPGGFALAAKKITLSTVGVVPGIIRFADEARPVHLAVSLHAATQEERAALVPSAKRWPLDQLMEACRYFVRKLERRIFFEWTLIEAKNDSPAHAHSVGRLLQGIPAQVNLIPLNPTIGYGGAPTRSEAARKFQDVLAEYGLPSTVRQRRGIDIAAGCGQLAVSARS